MKNNFIYVKIIKSKSKSSWYCEKIGEIYKVNKQIYKMFLNSTYHYYTLYVNNNYYININECIIIDRETKLKRILNDK